MKNIFKLLAVGGVLWISGCAQEAPKAETKVADEAHDHTTQSGYGEGQAHASTVHTHTTRMRVTTTPEVLEAGKVGTLTLQIVDNVDLTPINEYDIVHDKKLHLILTSSDLSWFSHIHPEFVGDGKFQMQTMIPRAGKYRLYADYKPKGEEGEVAYHEFEVKGENALPATPRLTADKMDGAWMIRNTQSALEGVAPTADAAKYQVALMPMPAKIVAGEDVMLHFQVRDVSGKPVESLQPYLGATGHCVILSDDPNIYLHTHPMEGDHADHGAAAPATGGGADVMFHTNFPKPGQYKIWGQFQHNDKIVTAPFVVNVEAGKSTPAAPQAPVEIPANAQKITIDLPDGYKAGAAKVKAGTPVALTFRLTKNAGCGNAIAVPAANWKQTLKVGESATVVYTPEKAGELKFACSMDMYRGTVIVN